MMKLPESLRSTVWTPILIFSLFAVGIAGTGIVYHVRQRAEIRRRIDDQLTTIANLKASQITTWRQERISDARVMAGNSSWLRQVRDYVERPDAARAREIRADLQVIQDAYDYHSIVLINAAGKPLLAVGGTGAVIGNYAGKNVLEAVRTRKVMLLDLHQSQPIDTVHMDLLVPLFTGDPANGSSRCFAVVLMRIDPYRFLYPLIQAWPVPSRTAETVLVRREGAMVVYLSQLRHRSAPVLSVRVPITASRLPAAVAVHGIEGIMDGVDYRGVPVLAVTRRIPDSPWFMVAKMDANEVYAPYQARSWAVVLAAGGLLLIAGLALSLWWQRQKTAFLREQVNAERQRQVLLRHFDYLVRYANDSILLAGPDRRLVEVNDRAVQNYGYSREELLEMSIADLRAPETLPSLAPQWEQAAAGAGVVYETIHRRKDGSTFPVEISLRVIDVDDKRFYQGIVRDITERKCAEEELIRERNLLHALMDNIPDSIYFKDLESRFTRISSALAGLLGLEVAADAVGKTDFDYFADHHARDALADEQTIIRSGQPLVGKTEKELRSDGRTRWVSTTKAPIFGPDGRVTGIVGISRDVTREKELEEQFIQAQKMEAIGRLAGGVAHDFNNILQAILGFSEILLLRMGQDDPRRGDLLEIKAASEKAKLLTNQLLTFSRKQVIDPRILDLSSLIEKVKAMLARVIGEDMVLETVTDPALWRVRADPVQIEQVIMNLVVNARDAMPKGGTITVRLANAVLAREDLQRMAEARLGRFVALSVADTGTGMSEEALGHIFEPFFTTKKMGQGTGLGLAMVYGAARQHEGWVHVETRPGQGSIFTVFIPAAVSAPEAAAGVVQPDEPMPPPGHGEQILLVEDEDAVREFDMRVLTGNGYRLLTAASGQEAQRIFDQEHGAIDLLLADVILPDANGVDLAEQFLARKPGLRIVFVSGYTSGRARLAAIRAKGHRFLQKPYRVTELLCAVREALDSKPPAAA